MFEQWFTWNIELMIEYNSMATGNKTTHVFLDYFIRRDMRRCALYMRMETIFEPYT